MSISQLWFFPFQRPQQSTANKNNQTTQAAQQHPNQTQEKKKNEESDKQNKNPICKLVFLLLHNIFS